jgi:hypothetical protein
MIIFWIKVCHRLLCRARIQVHQAANLYIQLQETHIVYAIANYQVFGNESCIFYTTKITINVFQ